MIGNRRRLAFAAFRFFGRSTPFTGLWVTAFLSQRYSNRDASDASRCRIVLPPSPRRVQKLPFHREAAVAVIVRGPRPCAGPREWAQAGPDTSGRRSLAVQVARARETVKAGLSARPALTAERASSSRPSCARAAAKLKYAKRIISVGLDRPSKPRDRLLLTAEVVLRNARDMSSRCKPSYRAD